MCSVAAMPTELILGHSPRPLLYSPLMVKTPPVTNRSVPPRIRPCLSAGSLNLDGLFKNNDDVMNKRKKRVVFADDRGRPLTEVRVMKEPSNVPPLWTNTFVAKVLKSRQLNPSGKVLGNSGQYPWEVCFAQPASDYLSYRRKLDQESVSLENVIIREVDQCLTGTVKVKNLAYDKEVVIRVSSDSWVTHEDVYCSFVECVHQPTLTSLYDTFRFSLTLPVRSNVIEFCVRYRTDGTEFWDNNCSKNYVVKKKQEVVLQNRDNSKMNDAAEIKAMHNRSNLIEDARRVNLPTWSEFASWQHLSSDGPYW